MSFSAIDSPRPCCSDHPLNCNPTTAPTTKNTALQEASQPSLTYYRPIGNPTPLGLCAFATTAFTAGVINAQLVPSTATKLIIPLALFYGGIVLFFAGVWELVRNNHFGGTSFCSYGAFWVGRGFFDYAVASSIPKEELRIAVGTIQLVWTVFTFIMMVASFRTNVVTCMVFVLIEVGFAPTW